MDFSKAVGLGGKINVYVVPQIRFVTLVYKYLSYTNAQCLAINLSYSYVVTTNLHSEL